MDFELKTLSLPGAAAEKTDALIVLVPLSFKAGKGALDLLVADALKGGHFEAKAGRLLSVWRAPGVAASRLVLAGAGDSSAKQVRQAVAAAVGALKATPVKRVTVCFALPATAGSLQGAMLAAASQLRLHHNQAQG